MVAMVGDPARLWPHVKTHKLPQVVRRQAELGVTRCKCATIAEAEMAAGAGAREVLLAQQPVGPTVHRLLALMDLFPEVEFSTILDDAGALAALGAAAQKAGRRVMALLDLDVGMGRTGILPGAEAVALYRAISGHPGLRPGGLHAYDGHLHQSDVPERRAAWENSRRPVLPFRDELRGLGLSVPRVIAGGTPTFPFYASQPEVECSPGTTVLWDAGYTRRCPDLPFLPAAALLTRVISKPATNRLCFDLGHKAVASEMPHPRAHFPALPDATAISHSEEHLVVETSHAAEVPVGTAFYAIPSHICPSVALHTEGWVVRNNRAEERWAILARTRRLTV
jgi:D-serine deaminase-like pyridoxal phosphate-dependent protein